MFKTIFAQIPLPEDTTMVDAVTEGAATKTISIVDLLMDPGTLIVVIPLLLMSIFGVYVFLERYFTLQKKGKIDANLLSSVRGFITEGNIQGAGAVCAADKTVYSNLIAKGIKRIGKPLQDIKTEIDNVAQIELNTLEKGFPLLATISGVAPMLGFLGTVMGMIVTFHAMKVGGQAVKVDELSGGIMQAMVTTVAGLIVGIIAYLAYNILSSKAQKIAHNMEEVSLSFMDILQEPAK